MTSHEENVTSLPDATAALATSILARGDVRVHPSQVTLRRVIRAAMEDEQKPVYNAHGFRFSLGKGPVWGFEGLPLCVMVTDIGQWHAAAAARKKNRRKR
mgnify:FL=1